jgi:glycosyltransferase involved in cell wall biosynthesis
VSESSQRREGRATISVVVPTYARPNHVRSLLLNLFEQELLPAEVIVVDGSPPDDDETRTAVEKVTATGAPFDLSYVRSAAGVSVQRNLGIENASSELVALIDDDIRLDRRFLHEISKVFGGDERSSIGGVCGFVDNQCSQMERHARWKLYRKLGLLETYDPGRYDRSTGYAVNTYFQPPFEGVNEVDYLSGGYTVWRRQVFDSGLRFAPEFGPRGPLEDQHFSLRAGRRWKLLKCGSAHCEHLHAPQGRSGSFVSGYRAVRNCWWVFRDCEPAISFGQLWRFWRLQLVVIGHLLASSVVRLDPRLLTNVVGRKVATALTFPSSLWHVVVGIRN